MSVDKNKFYEMFVNPYSKFFGDPMLLLLAKDLEKTNIVRDEVKKQNEDNLSL